MSKKSKNFDDMLKRCLETPLPRKNRKGSDQYQKSKDKRGGNKKIGFIYSSP
jgi:hypothetical protein